MRKLISGLKRAMPLLLMLCGVGAIVVAFGANKLGLGGGGFGSKQVALALLGAGMLLAGLLLGTPVGRRYLARWRATIAADDARASVLLIAVWFGLLAGWVETAYWVIKKYFLYDLIYRSPDSVWTTPLASLALFVVLGLALTFLQRRWPQRLSRESAILILAALSGMSLLFLFPRLSKLAAVILALGLGVQVSRLANKHPAAFDRLIRYTVGWPVFLWGGGRRKAQDPKPQRAAAAQPGDQYNPQSNREAPLQPASPSRREFLVGTTTGIAAVALGVRGWGWRAERQAVAAIPPSRQSHPNVLLIVLDTVRAASLSLHGYGRKTSPQLERLAAKGVCFDWAISTAPWTLPSHGSMFTGQLPQEFRYGQFTSFTSTAPTLAELLGSCGYMTSGFVANPRYCGREIGLARGFAHYEDYLLTPGAIALSSALGRTILESPPVYRALADHQNYGRKSAAQVTHYFLAWLAARKENRPFFAFLNYFDAHDPYLPPAEYLAQFTPERRFGHLASKKAQEVGPEGVRRLNDAYDGAIAYVDHHIGVLLDELEQRGVLDDSLVIITSDHGEQFGEHGLMGHGNSAYLQLLHVPLILLGPSSYLPAGRRIAEPVSLRDVARTIIEFTGVDCGVVPAGVSLASYWERAGAAPQQSDSLAFSEVSWDNLLDEAAMHKVNMRSVIAAGAHYISNPDGSEELYRYAGDPAETQNLVGSADESAVLDQLRAYLAQM